jgi:hypothetical protein
MKECSLMGGLAPELCGGLFRNPLDASGILALQLFAPAAGGAPPSLAALLLRFARRDISGTLGLDCGAGHELAIPILEGRAYVRGQQERTLLAQLFAAAEGSFRFAPGVPSALERREKLTLVRLAVEGLRAVLRRFSEEQLEQALGQRLAMTARARSDREQVVASLALADHERRVLGVHFDGQRPLREILGSCGLGRRAVLQLVCVLALFDCLEWRAASDAAGTSAQAKAIEERLGRLAQGNHFEALEVHWSATGEEIAAAYRRMSEQLRQGGRWDSLAPAACARLRARVEEAFRTLSNDEARVRYRRQAYPDINFEAADALVEGRIRSLEMRVDGRGLSEAKSTKKELQISRSAGGIPPRRK